MGTGYALTSVGHHLPLVNVLGASPLNAIMSVQKS